MLWYAYKLSLYIYRERIIVFTIHIVPFKYYVQLPESAVHPVASTVLSIEESLRCHS